MRWFLRFLITFCLLGMAYVLYLNEQTIDLMEQIEQIEDMTKELQPDEYYAA